MKSYYVTFYLAGRPVCARRQKAATQELAEMMAEFSLMCLFPNVNYDRVDSEEVTA